MIGIVYTTEAAAEMESVSPWVIADRCRNGEYPGAYRSGRGKRSSWRIPEESIEHYREANVPDEHTLEPRSTLSQVRRTA